MNQLYFGTVTHNLLNSSNLPKGYRNVSNYIVSAPDSADAKDQLNRLESQFPGQDFKIIGFGLFSVLPNQPQYMGVEMVMSDQLNELSLSNVEKINYAIMQQRSGDFSRITLKVVSGAYEYEICGTKTNVADLSIPIVRLLREDSTLQNMVVAESAVDDFEQAIHQMLRTDRPFCTVLRGGWNLPDYVWTRV